MSKSLTRLDVWILLYLLSTYVAKIHSMLRNQHVRTLGWTSSEAPRLPASCSQSSSTELGIHARFGSWHHWADPWLGPHRRLLTNIPPAPTSVFRNGLVMHILSTAGHADGKERAVYFGAGFWLGYMLIFMGQIRRSRRHLTNPLCAPCRDGDVPGNSNWNGPGGRETAY